MIAAILAAMGSAEAAPTAPDKCEAAKNKAAGLYSLCRQRVEAVRILNGDLTKYAASIAKCEEKLAKHWQIAIDKATAKGATCSDAPLTAADFKAVIDGHAANVATALNGGGLTPCFQIAPCTIADHPTLDTPGARLLLHPVTGHCYVYVPVGLDWFTADDLCSQAGGELAVPSDSAENDTFVAEVRGAGGPQVWIGINDTASEGLFFSVTGESFATQWGAGEPNNVGNEDCVAMLSNTNWFDLGCSTAAHLVCEFAP